MSFSLELKNITKTFGKNTIYKDLSFDFDKSIYAITGPNGSGKTVLLEMLSGVSMPNSGCITFQAKAKSNNIKYKKILSYVPCYPVFYPAVTGIEYLKFIHSVKGIKSFSDQTLELIHSFQLTPHLQTKFKDMSLGTQKKLFLLTMMIGQNELLILDEPTNGLDDNSIHVLGDLLIKLSNSAIIVLSSHDRHFLQHLKPKIIKLGISPITDLNLT